MNVFLRFSFGNRLDNGIKARWTSHGRILDFKHSISKDIGNWDSFSVNGSDERNLRSPVPVSVSFEFREVETPLGVILEIVCRSFSERRGDVPYKLAEQQFILSASRFHRSSPLAESNGWIVGLSFFLSSYLLTSIDDLDRVPRFNFKAILIFCSLDEDGLSETAGWREVSFVHVLSLTDFISKWGLSIPSA